MSIFINILYRIHKIFIRYDPGHKLRLIAYDCRKSRAGRVCFYLKILKALLRILNGVTVVLTVPDNVSPWF